MSFGPGFFVTGTDTGVGKTAVAGALAAALRADGIDVGVMKPVQTGAVWIGDKLMAPDAEYLKVASGVTDRAELVCPVMLETPAAPMIAAEMAMRPIAVATILSAFRQLAGVRECMVVEGAGGLAVPITADYLMVDLARAMRLPLLVVARASLGTINHTVLTVKYAEAAGLTVAGVIINRYPSRPDVAERTNAAVIEQLCGVPVLGVLPDDAAIDTENGRIGNSLTAMQKSGIVDRLKSSGA